MEVTSHSSRKSASSRGRTFSLKSVKTDVAEKDIEGSGSDEVSKELTREHGMAAQAAIR